MNRFTSFAVGTLRSWHRYAGVGLALLLVVIALTGILLNHRDWLPGAPAAAMRPAKGKARLTPSLDTAPLLPLTDALAIAKAKLGADTPVDSIALSQGHDGLAWTFKSQRSANPGFELTVDAKTGETALKTTTGLRTTAADGQTSFNWSRLAMDLHTGKFWSRTLGPWLFSDLAAVGLLLLTVSGLCLWAVPAWRRRKFRKQTAPLQPLQPSASA